MLDNTVDMIFMFDPVSLRFVYANRGVEETLGYSRETLLKMRATELMSSMPEHVFRSQIAQLLSGGRPWLSYETTQRRKDGVEVPYRSIPAAGALKPWRPWSVHRHRA